MPEVGDDRQRVEESRVRHRHAGHRRRGQRCDGSRSHPLQVSSIRCQGQAIAGIDEVPAQMLHQRQLALTLLADGLIRLCRDA